MALAPRISAACASTPCDVVNAAPQIANPSVLPSRSVTATKGSSVSLHRRRRRSRAGTGRAKLSSVDQLDRVFSDVTIRQRSSRAYSNITVRGQSSVDFYNPATQLYVDGLPQDQNSLHSAAAARSRTDRAPLWATGHPLWPQRCRRRNQRDDPKAGQHPARRERSCSDKSWDYGTSPSFPPSRSKHPLRRYRGQRTQRKRRDERYDHEPRARRQQGQECARQNPLRPH